MHPFYFFEIFRFGDVSLNFRLKIVTGKIGVLLNSVQEFIAIEAWLLLTFFIGLHNELSSIRTIDTYERAHVFENGDSANGQKMNSCSFQQVHGKI